MISILKRLEQGIELRESLFDKPFIFIALQFDVEVHSTGICSVLFERWDGDPDWRNKIIVVHNRYYCKYCNQSKIIH